MLGNLLRRLLRRAPAPAAGFLVAYRLFEEGRLDDAAQACDAVRDVPRADVALLRGLIAQRRGDLEAALAAMTAALEERPQEPTFHEALAKVLITLGRQRQAIDHIERFLEFALENDPRRLPACVNAGQCCLALHDDEGAQMWFRRARALDPGDEKASLLISGALYESFMPNEARNAITAGPRKPPCPARLRRALMVPAVYQSVDEIETTRERLTRELDELLDSPAEPVEDPVADIGVTPFYLAYHNRNNTGLVQKVCLGARRAYRAPGDSRAPRPRGARVRIGFVSRYLYSHSVARAPGLGLIRDLPRESFTVSVFAVAPLEDGMRAAVERAADQYFRLPPNLNQVRQAILSANLDVLVFTDIGMDPLTYFLAFSRLAPVQLTTWGHSETSGIDTIDYYLSAAGLELSDAQPHYTERLLRLNAFFLGGYARPVPTQAPDRDALGLPRTAHLYMCLQPAFKLHPDIDAVFGGILERDPQAQIVLLEPAAPRLATALKQRLTRTLPGYAQRLRFLDTMAHARYLATLACADAALDPLYFGGCNSSVEALSLGVPIVTLPGTHAYGRFTLGLYDELGVHDCVTASVEDYVTKAMQLAGDADYRMSVGTRIRERAHLMFERKDATLAFARWVTEELLA